MSKNKRSRNKQSTFIAWFASVGLALILAIVASLQFTAQAQAAEDDAKIKQVTLTSFSAAAQAVVLPNTVKQSAAINLKTDATSSQTAQGIQVAHTRAKQMFDDIYASDCAVCKNIVKGTHDSIDAQAKGKFRALGWSVKDVNWLQVVIDGQNASVTLAATLSSPLQYIDEYGKLNTVNPTQGIVKIYSLSKINNKWLITNIVEDAEAEQTLPVNQVKPHGISGTPPPDETPPTKGNGPQGTKPTPIPTASSSSK